MFRVSGIDSAFGTAAASMQAFCVSDAVNPASGRLLPRSMIRTRAPVCPGVLRALQIPAVHRVRAV